MGARHGWERVYHRGNEARYEAGYDSGEAVVERGADGGAAGGDPELGVDAAEVGVDRPRAEKEAVGGLGVGEAGGDQPQHLRLPLAEAEAGSRWVRRALRCPVGGGDGGDHLPPDGERGVEGEAVAVGQGGGDSGWAEGGPQVGGGAVEVEAVARSGGELVGTGNAAFTVYPYVVEAGGVAIGSVFFGGQELPDDVAYGFDLAAVPVGEESARAFQRDLVVEEVNVDDDGIVGMLRNPHEEAVATANVTVACFDETGAMTEYGSMPLARTIAEGVEPDDTVVFEVGIGGPLGPLAGPCPAFLVVAGGSAGS